MTEGLTLEEREVVARFGAAFMSFLLLPPCHIDDMKEVKAHVHAIQNAIMARAAVRAHPADFNFQKEFG